VLDARKRRIAENEARFRAINDRLAHDVRALTDDDERTDFVCECGKADCVHSLALTLDEYRHVRDDPLLFAVVPGHEIPDAEDVLTTTDRYAVVRKHAEAAPLVEDGPGPAA
jgi:hypothetical protein